MCQTENHKLTVKDLREAIDNYLSGYGSENDEIKVVDDGMHASFFDVEVICGTKFERKIDDCGHYEKPQNVLILTFDKFREV